jgi:hypothetical protein
MGLLFNTNSDNFIYGLFKALPVSQVTQGAMSGESVNNKFEMIWK